MNKDVILNENKNEFHLILSRFSHELRNPIALINSELQMIEDNHPEVMSFDYWNDISSNLEYAKELLNSLSDYNNASRLLLKRTELRSYLEALLSSVRPTYEYLGITLDTQLALTLPTISIDHTKLKQALLNLLRNAAEAITGTDGKVTFSASYQDEQFHISITDNGCGISDEQLEKIFTPFVTFKKNGTGLGLAITRQIIMAHGGKIYAQSDVEQGTSFHILLPATLRG